MVKLVNYNLIAQFLLPFLIFLSYLKIIDFDFQIRWDDQWVVINTYTDAGFTFENLRNIVLEFYHGQYAPVNQLYYTLIKSLFGYDATAFHSAGIIIHVLNAICAYEVMKSILFFGVNLSSLTSKRAALLAAILFAVHPVNLEAVAWISASKILLYSLFYLLAIQQYICYLLKKRYPNLLLTFFFFILSFGAKEQAVTFPICLIALDLTFGRKAFNPVALKEKIPFFLAALYFGILTILSQNVDAAEPHHYTYSITERLFLACYSLTEYFTKCILPVKLSYLYPFPFEPNAEIPMWIKFYPLFLILIIPILLRAIRDKITFFCLSFFLIHIVLALNLLNLSRFAVVADRYVYLSSLGICLLVAMVFIKGLHVQLKYLALTKSIAILYVTLFVVYSNQHSVVWKNSNSLKQSFGELIKNREDYQEIKTQNDAENLE